MQTTAELMQQGSRVCAGCNGQMRVAGGLVGCDICGTTDETHPLTVASRAARGERFDAATGRVVKLPDRPAPPRERADPVIEHFEGGQGHRILMLEKAMKNALARIAMLEQGAARRPKG